MSLGIHFPILLCQTKRQYLIWRTVSVIQDVQDRNRSGRPSVLSDDSLGDIRHTLLCSPRKSLRETLLQSGLSYGSVHKATNILKLHPYREHVMHELKEPDKDK
jgi:hypothetical protein